MPSPRVAFILVIQIQPGLAVVLIWIIPCPPSNHRWRAFIFLTLPACGGCAHQFFSTARGSDRR